MPTTSSRSPERVSLERLLLFATSSRSLVTERVTGWQEKESESGKYLVPGLIQDTQPVTLTQLMARGLHN